MLASSAQEGGNQRLAVGGGQARKAHFDVHESERARHWHSVGLLRRVDECRDRQRHGGVGANATIHMLNNIQTNQIAINK
jgi:hypothetical protein